MSVQQHVEALRAKHAVLEDAIEIENARPHPDDVRLHELKREKLRIKDEISTIESHAVA
jgi:hypothetical protein